MTDANEVAEADDEEIDTSDISDSLEIVTEDKETLDVNGTIAESEDITEETTSAVKDEDIDQNEIIESNEEESVLRIDDNLIEQENTAKDTEFVADADVESKEQPETDELFPQEIEETNETNAEASVEGSSLDESIQEAVSQPSVTISSDLIRGHINTIILRTLSEGDRYGLEIIQEIERKTCGQYTIKQPTLYSSLRRLENSGYITSYWGSGETNGGRRRYYALTDNGRKITDQNRAEWEYSRTIIDNLISTKEYDLNATPPTAIDFTLLKGATTRVFGADRKESEKEISAMEEKREELHRQMEEEQDALDRLKSERDDVNLALSETLEKTREIEQLQAMRLEELEQQKAELEKLKREQEEIALDISRKQEYANAIPTVSEMERTERDYKNILGRIFPQENVQSNEPMVNATETLTNYNAQPEPEEEKIAERDGDFEKYPDFWSFEEETVKNSTKNEEKNAFVRMDEAENNHFPETETYERNDNFSEFIRKHTETSEEMKRRDAIQDYASTPKRRQGKIDFSDIFAYADRNQMRVRSYVGNKTASNQTQKNSLLFVNKVRALSICLLYLIMMSELVLCYVFTADIVGWKTEFFYAGIVFTVLPVFALTLLLSASQKLIVPRNNGKEALLTSIIVIFNFFLILIVLALVMEVNLSNTPKLLLHFGYPILLSLNLPVYIIIKNVLTKSGKFNTAS
ncbi:MAG: hypothetical protein E7363_02345 [Clostridiales bacterium]|nr:hypothetical protein [Clostridiales bacterium]